MKYSAILFICTFFVLTAATNAISQNSIDKKLLPHQNGFAEQFEKNQGTYINNVNTELQTYYTYPLNSAATLPQYQADRKYILNGILIGSAIGTATGGIIGFITYEECNETGAFSCFLHLSREQSTGFGAILGLVVGAISGGFMGAVIKADKRKRVQVTYQPHTMNTFDSKSFYAHGFSMKYSFN